MTSGLGSQPTGASARYRGRMGRLAVVSLLLLAVVALPATATTAAKSGLRGAVTLAPSRPVCIEGQPCSKPARNVRLVFRRNGCVAARVQTGSNGSYRVFLRPGRYTVEAPAFRRGSGVTPRTVRVPRGRIARIDLEIDTGLQ